MMSEPFHSLGPHSKLPRPHGVVSGDNLRMRLILAILVQTMVPFLEAL